MDAKPSSPSSAAAAAANQADRVRQRPSSVDLFDSQDWDNDDRQGNATNIQGSDWQNGQTPSQLRDAMDSEDDGASGVGMDVPNTAFRSPILSPATARNLQRQFANQRTNGASVTFAPLPESHRDGAMSRRARPTDLPIAAAMAANGLQSCGTGNPDDGQQRAGPIVEFGQRTRETCCSPVKKLCNFFHAVEYHEPGGGKEGFFLLVNKDRKESPLKMFRSHMVELAVALPAGLAQLDKLREYRTNPPDVETQHVVRLITRYTANIIDRDTNRPTEATFEVRLTASTGSTQIRGPSLWVRRYFIDRQSHACIPTFAGVKFVEGDDPAELMRFVKECGQTDNF